MKAKIRNIVVQSLEDLSPHMRRIVFAGPDLADFPDRQESAHVKVIVPEQNASKRGFWPALAKKSRMRSYTIRFFDHAARTLTMDFAVNDHRGLVADWALTTKVGDSVQIAGPGSIKHTDFDAEWHLLLADLTALPALAATLERLPNSARGHIVVQVPTIADKQDLAVPDNMTIQWIINADTSQNLLLKALPDLEWLPGEPAMFVATESSHVVEIRKYLREQPGFRKDKLYASGYWTA
ncbi:MAG: siderophore-interacting protein [Woeseiaceae bacterium]